ncbi:syntaxin-like protein [Amanita muscaria]
MSLPKLTSVSTQTLSLLLERQRLQSLPLVGPSDTHLQQIVKNFTQLRTGILKLEANEGRTEAVALLKSQFERMRGMLGDEGNVESLSKDGTGAPLGGSSLLGSSKDFASSASYTPYKDEPEESHPDTILQVQQQLLGEQDEHLDQLSRSINRQHHISLQINDELGVHTGLLEELDTEVDRTGSRLSSARRRLDKLAKGARENSSTVTIGLLILVLLVLIIVFKT